MGRNQPRNCSSYGSVTEIVLEEVAEYEGVDPIEITPRLQAAIDVDALESLFSSTIAGEQSEAIRLEFSYSGYHIVVEDDETVEILNE